MIFAIGMFAKEKKAANGVLRCGAITKMTKCYVWVEGIGKMHFKKLKRNVEPTTREDMMNQKKTPIHVDDGAIDVGATITCVFGVHIGTVAVVTGSTKCFYKFVDANGKLRKVTKQYARRVVAATPTKRTPNKKRKLA